VKTYDEITNSVLEGAAVRTVKIKRTRYACTATAVCAACVIGGAAFMKLEKPEFKPSDSYIETSDSLHSASDPSTECTTETTPETTVPTETTLATTTSPAPTTEITTTTEPFTDIPNAPVTVPIPVFVESGPAPIMTVLPGETHPSSQSTHKTTTTQKATEPTTVRPETTKAPETDAVETTMILTEVLPVITTEPTEIPTEALTEEIPTEAPEIIEPDPTETTEPAPVPEFPDERWELLYELYFNGELPFTLLDMEDMDENELIESLFPMPEDFT